ncbi:uncharacterized protein TNCV_91731 [Trichonephila clavipes]|nr:uncharacterized protein TNCV_91731 [Trichonephila clavipes]
MDVCKYIVHLLHGGTLNSHRAASPLAWLVEGEERWETSGHLQDFLPLNWSGTEQNRTVTCMVLKANDRNRLIERHGAVNEKKGRPAILLSPLRLTEKNFLEAKWRKNVDQQGAMFWVLLEKKRFSKTGEKGNTILLSRL